MEQPRLDLTLQRALAIVLVGTAVALAWAERQSPLARAVAERRPWSYWQTLGPAESPWLYLAYYRPDRRTLDLVYVPQELKVPGGTVAKVLAKSGARLAGEAAAPEPEWLDLPVESDPESPTGDEPAVAGAEALTRAREVGHWARLRGFDRWLLALELARLRPEQVRPAWLPEGEAGRAFLKRLPEPPADAPPSITVEVLNGTGKPGFASQAKRVLRFGGADVVTTGNSDLLEGRTLVYDRVGRFENALAVRRMLGCPAAATATQLDPKRLVDVSVVLADDCPLP